MWEERIIVDPKILVGKPVVKGTRLAVDFILDLLAQGWSHDEIIRNYPGPISSHPTHIRRRPTSTPD